eukprot:3394752-Rhodomonas_salina.1
MSSAGGGKGTTKKTPQGLSMIKKRVRNKGGERSNKNIPLKLEGEMVYPTRNEGGKKPWAIKVTIKGGYCIMRKLTDMEAPFPNARFDAESSSWYVFLKLFKLWMEFTAKIEEYARE